MLASQFQKLRDDDLRKINATLQADFINGMTTYHFPCCPKGGNHADQQISYAIIKQEDKSNSLQLTPGCNVCLSEEQKNQENTKPNQILHLKQLLVDSYQIANDQCHPNLFEECIKPTLVLLETSLNQLIDLKERLAIYCEQLAEKISTLSQKTQMFPPIRVRNSLNNIKESAKVSSEDVKNSIISSELAALSELLNIDDKGIPVVKGGSIDVSLFYLLAEKAKSDASILNQCLDKSCFVLNDLDHAENNPAYAAKLISNFKDLKSAGSLKEPAYQDYKRRMAHVGLSEADLQVDKNIDFSVIYLYEKHKLQGFVQNNNNYQRRTNYLETRQKIDRIKEDLKQNGQKQQNFQLLQQHEKPSQQQQQRNVLKPPEHPYGNLNVLHNFNSNNEISNNRSNVNLISNNSMLQQQQDNLLLKKRVPIFQKKESSLQQQKRDQEHQQHDQEQMQQQRRDYSPEI